MRLIHRMMRAWRLRARDEGAVTAEFAVALPAVIAVLAICLSAAAVGIAQSRLEESSRVAARAFARGDNLAAVQHEVSRIDPSINLQVQTVEETSGARQVRVQVERAAPGVIGSVTGWRLQATATARPHGLRAARITPRRLAANKHGHARFHLECMRAAVCQTAVRGG